MRSRPPVASMNRARVARCRFSPIQAARNLFLSHSDQLAGARALVRDRGSQFIDGFDEIFRTEHMKILKTPIRTPVANAFAERWIASLRRTPRPHPPLERDISAEPTVRVEDVACCRLAGGAVIAGDVRVQCADLAPVRGPQ